MLYIGVMGEQNAQEKLLAFSKSDPVHQWRWNMFESRGAGGKTTA